VEKDGTKEDSYEFNSVYTKDVSFRYNSTSEPALNSINARFDYGKQMAIVGPSGSGKSTIVSLLARFYNATSGAIYLDDQPLLKTSVSAYRSHLGLISQETILFEGAILDNILLAVPASQATRERAEKAARQAHIHEFITSLPEGYGTECGANGVELSGGQRQRLAIARALARKPKLLLLDEPTSALDADSERAVMDALKGANRDRIVATVTHRLGTIRDADAILVLANGQVTEYGNHDSLLSQQGVYWRMWRAQPLLRTITSFKSV
jgi:ATP-binding cassette, subfamily B (MDR/TAP), member 1